MIKRSADRKALIGCQACKRRKKRCDKTLPNCLHCMRAGLLCEGLKLLDTSTVESHKPTKSIILNDRTHLSASQQARSWQNSAGASHSGNLDSDLQRVEAPGRSFQALGITGNDLIHVFSEPDDNLDDDQPPRRRFGTRDGYIVAYGLQQSASCTRYVPGVWNMEDVEVRAIQWFHEHTLAAMIALDPTAERFATILVPQMSLDEPIVSNQLVALSIGHHAAVNGLDSASLEVRKYLGKALKRLTTLKRHDQTHLFLTSCLLFIALNVFVQQNPTAAFHHVRCGFKILGERMAELKNGAQLTSSDIITRTYIEPVFEGLAVAAGPQGSPTDTIETLDDMPSVPQGQLSVEEARKKVYELTQWTKRAYNGPSYYINVSTLSTSWQKWLETVLPQLEKFPDEHAYLHAKLLNIHCQMADLAFECMLDEMQWDLHIEFVRAQLAACVEIYYNEASYEHQQGFLTVPGIHPPLWQMTQCCRDPAIRYQARDLLNMHQERCGIKESSSLIVAGFAAHVEEGNGIEIRSCGDVPPHHRIKLVPFDHNGPLTTPVSIKWYPYGPKEILTVPVSQIKDNPRELKESLDLIRFG